MNPTEAEIENGMPRSAMANTPPASAMGTAVNTVAVSETLPIAM
jgi:hypothetical protein